MRRVSRIYRCVVTSRGHSHEPLKIPLLVCWLKKWERISVTGLSGTMWNPLYNLIVFFFIIPMTIASLGRYIHPNPDGQMGVWMCVIPWKHEMAIIDNQLDMICGCVCKLGILLKLQVEWGKTIHDGDGNDCRSRVCSHSGTWIIYYEWGINASCLRLCQILLLNRWLRYNSNANLQQKERCLEYKRIYGRRRYA